MAPDSSGPSLDLGAGHRLSFTAFSPDRDLNPPFADVPDIDRCGFVWKHPHPDGSGTCKAGGMFDVPGVAEVFAGRPRWQVLSWEPLALEPSLLCRGCGTHGWIRDGRWVPC